jgi:hypothetical protein
MARSFPRTGKRIRPKTADKGKRYLCAKCRKRSPRPVKAPAPWYCPKCLAEQAREDAAAAEQVQSTLRRLKQR